MDSETTYVGKYVKIATEELNTFILGLVTKEKSLNGDNILLSFNECITVHTRHQIYFEYYRNTAKVVSRDDITCISKKDYDLEMADQLAELAARTIHRKHSMGEIFEFLLTV